MAIGNSSVSSRRDCVSEKIRTLWSLFLSTRRQSSFPGRKFSIAYANTATTSSSRQFFSLRRRWIVIELTISAPSSWVCNSYELPWEGRGHCRTTLGSLMVRLYSGSRSRGKSSSTSACCLKAVVGPSLLSLILIKAHRPFSRPPTQIQP